VKIEYDVKLYRKIANFRINEVVQVSNRKGQRYTIHITNITQLSWQQLQLLVSHGADRFSKMVYLYNEYSSKKEVSESVVRGKPLTKTENDEINEYIKIFRDNNLTKHHEINDMISKTDSWNKFPTIRSLNEHGKHKEIPGIQPHYFEIVCNILYISGEGGLSLDSYKKY
jgi:transposase